jgi:hypothetical protein
MNLLDFNLQKHQDNRLYDEAFLVNPRNVEGKMLH